MSTRSTSSLSSTALGSLAQLGMSRQFVAQLSGQSRRWIGKDDGVAWSGVASRGVAPRVPFWAVDTWTPSTAQSRPVLTRSRGVGP